MASRGSSRPARRRDGGVSTTWLECAATTWSRSRRFGARPRRTIAADTRRKATRSRRRSDLVAASAIAAVLILAAACGRIRDAVSNAAGERQRDEFVRIVLALGQRDPDSLDFYAGPP